MLFLLLIASLIFLGVVVFIFKADKKNPFYPIVIGTFIFTGIFFILFALTVSVNCSLSPL